MHRTGPGRPLLLLLKKGVYMGEQPVHVDVVVIDRGKQAAARDGCGEQTSGAGA
jgi:hypothetical protein